MSRFDDAFRTVASESLGKATIAFDWVEHHKVEAAAIVVGTAALAIGGRSAAGALMRTGGEPLTEAELNLARRGFQLPRSVPRGTTGLPGPTFKNRLAADTVEGSVLSRVSPAASFGYPKDSFITLEGNRKNAQIVLHLADGTEISHSPGFGTRPWKAILPDRLAMYSGSNGTMMLGRADRYGAIQGYTIARNGQMTLPETLEDVQLRQQALPKFLQLKTRYPEVTMHRRSEV